MRKFRVLLCICHSCLLLTGILSGCGVANNAPPDAMLAVSLVYGDYEGGGEAAPEQTPDASETPAQTPSETPAASDTPAPATQNGSSVNTTAATTAATTAKADDTTAKNSDTTVPTSAQQEQPSEQPAQPAADAAPTAAADVVALYKEAYAKIAAEATGATQTWTNAQNQPQIVEAGALSSVAGTLMNTFLKESSPNAPLAPADVPPKGVTTCNLDMAYVAEATCADNGGTYEVRIKLNTTQDSPEVNPSLGSTGVGAISDVIEVSEITDAAGAFINFENMENRYFETEITATIDKATKHITELYVKCPSIMCFGKAAVKPLGIPSIENARLGLTYENRYTIAY